MAGPRQAGFPKRPIHAPAGLVAGGRGRPGRPLAVLQVLRARIALSCLLVIAVADLLIWRWKAPYAVEGLLDEPAHVATGLLALAAFGGELQAPIVLAVLAGSLLIDVDHLPHAFGSNILEHGIPRPYTHSLGTIIVLLVVVSLLRNSWLRRLGLVATLVLALHFFRDAAEPRGPGVSVLWPISNQAVSVAYGWYAAVLVALTAIALGRADEELQDRPRAMAISE